MSAANVALIQHFEDRFVAGDLDEVRKLLADDVVVHEAPNVPYPGDHRGREAFVALAQAFNESWKFPASAEFRFLDAGDDGVIVRVEAEVTARRTGRRFQMRIAEFYEIIDGRIADVSVFYWDTAAMRDAVSASPLSA